MRHGASQHCICRMRSDANRDVVSCCCLPRILCHKCAMPTGRTLYGLALAVICEMPASSLSCRATMFTCRSFPCAGSSWRLSHALALEGISADELPVATAKDRAHRRIVLASSAVARTVDNTLDAIGADQLCRYRSKLLSVRNSASTIMRPLQAPPQS